jgi:mercuric reductase
MPVCWAELVAQKDEIIQEYRAHKYESLLDDPERIQIVPGQARLLSDHEVEVQSADEVRRLEGSQILIATGSAPSIPHLPGLSAVPYLTSDLLSSDDDPWGTELREQPRSLLILGGGYIALELGQMFARFGTQVTLITRGRTILSGYEPEIAEGLTEILKAEGLRIVTGAQVRGVERSGEEVAHSLKLHGSQQTLSAERLLVGHAAMKLLTGIAAPEPASRRSLARSRRCLRFPAQTKGVGSRFQPVTVCSSQLITSCACLGC